LHSDVIHIVRSPSPGALAGDGLITNVPEIALGVLTADCIPVLLVDRKNRVVGAFHAGWRGTAKRIVEKGLGLMRREYGSLPEDIHAVIGPGIQKCCYEVGEELRNEFESQFAYARELFHEVQESDPVRQKYPMLFMNARAPGHGDPCIKLHLDLREANRRQLLTLGVPARQITALKDCTACDTKKFFSHRAEKGRTGRMMAVIGLFLKNPE
jgi:YfiH family protein